MAQFDLDSYIAVNERIIEFYKRYPEGSIQTEILSNIDGQVIMMAHAFRDREDKIPCTGLAMEKAGSSFINKGSHIENCETSAVGRALAMMGFEVKKNIASKEEVQTARLNQDKKEPIKEIDTISKTQQKRLFELAKGNVQVAKEVLLKHKYTNSDRIKKVEYETICQEIKKAVE